VATSAARVARIGALLAASALGFAPTLRAQDGVRPATAAASAYLPVDDPAYGILDALQRRGLLRTLPALERPYTVAQVQRALVAIDTAALPGTLRRWVARVSRAIEKYAVTPSDDADAVTLKVHVGAMATAQSSGLRELMLADSTAGAHPGLNARALLRRGPLVAAFRLRGDNALQDDPEYAGYGGGLPGAPGGGLGVSGRAEEAYASLQLPALELFAGRLSRNWGPSAYDGLLLGRAAWSYDHVMARIGDERFRLTWLTARLTDYGPDSRWFTARRVAGRLGAIELGLSESVVYSGPGRQLEWGLSNPFIPAYLSLYNDREAANLNVAFDVAATTSVGLFAAQTFVDDVQLDGVTPKPWMYGVTLTADGLPLSGAHRWFVNATEISNLTYRNVTTNDVYTTDYVSLGRGFTDYREVRIGADLAVFAQGTFRPYFAMRWQGTGTYRNPFPPEAVWPSTPRILQGPVMTIARVGLESTVYAGDAFEIVADVGVNRISSLGYVPGSNVVRPAGRVRVQWEPRRAWRAVFGHE
jgi:hypothetical protein